jgi:predicted NUDIX family NTP pyrophosphohydrolase
MPELSAGIALWRRRGGDIEILLAHFGGPYWANRDAGAWAIPKGLVEPGETLEACARREFAEEIGTEPTGSLNRLGRIRQKGGKWVVVFSLEGDLDAHQIVSKTFDLEWPPKSGRVQAYPEIDRAAWFSLVEAHAHILPSQIPILDLLEMAVST